MTSELAELADAGDGAVSEHARGSWHRPWSLLTSTTPRPVTGQGGLTSRIVARVAGLFCGVGAVAALLTAQFRPISEAERQAVIGICLLGILIALVIWVAPWHRWRHSMTLLVVPLAFLMVALGGTVALNPYEISAYYVAGFVWIGMAHPRFTSVRMVPLLLAAYFLPFALGEMIDSGQIISGALTVTILCVLVGETLAWLVASLRRVHEELATRRIAARYRALVQNASDLVAVVGPDASILYLSPSVERMLGYRPADLKERRFTELFVDGSGPEVLSVLGRLSRSAGASATREWQVRHADGSTRVIETVAVNLAEDPDIGGIVLTGRDVTERQALEAQLSHEALHDALTGLANRILFHDRVTHAIARARRRPERVAMLFLDLDEFKDVNDSLGHQAGDFVLRAVATRLDEIVRSADTVARLGGDEFAVLVEDVEDAEASMELGERLLDEVRRPIHVGDTELVLGASVGVVLASHETEDADALVRDADIAMYAAKEAGKDRVELFRPAMQRRISERIQLVADLRRAIEEEELSVVYQPFIDLTTERVVGVEALVRWRHASRGLLLPGAFIGAAEESGLIVALGDYVLREAARAAQAWRAIRPDPMLVSVNLSPRQFNDERLLGSVEAILAETGLPRETLVLEITENVLIGDLPSARAKLTALRDMGTCVAIDDFGMGYSSLNYLRALPVDILKIDRAFVTGLGTEDGADPLVAAIIQMARVMELETIAEAVETPREAERLRELDCRLAQGFYFARPMSAAEMTRLWSSGGDITGLPPQPDPEPSTWLDGGPLGVGVTAGEGAIA